MARNAGSHGVLEILDGGLLRILDGNGTHGPEFQIARHKGSVGRLVIDGTGSSLEVIQSGPAVHGDPNVFPGPGVGRSPGAGPGPPSSATAAGCWCAARARTWWSRAMP